MAFKNAVSTAAIASSANLASFSRRYGQRLAVEKIASYQPLSVFMRDFQLQSPSSAAYPIVIIRAISRNSAYRRTHHKNNNKERWWHREIYFRSIALI